MLVVCQLPTLIDMPLDRTEFPGSFSVSLCRIGTEVSGVSKFEETF